MPAVLERIAEQLGEDQRQRGRTIPCQDYRRELGRHLAACPDPLHEHRPEPVEELREIDVLVPLLGQHLVDGRDREDPVHRVHQRLARIDVLGIARLQPQERRHRLQVVLDAVVDLLREHTAHDGAPVLERDGGLLGDRAEQLAVGLGERGRAVGHELADLPAAPPQRLPDRVRVGLALRPGDRAVLEHERRTGRRERVHGRLHDRLERLLQVERLRHGLGDPRQRLQLVHAALRLLVELRVLDRLRHLGCDHEQQVDLLLGELPRLARPDVERALEPLGAGEDRHREDRLVLVLGQVGEVLEALVEVRLRRDHHRLPRLRGRARDPLAGTHPRPLRHLLDACPMRRAEDELAGALVVEVDEARVCVERVRHLGRDQRKHLLEVERGVDRLDRVGQEAQVAFALIHPFQSVRSADVSTIQWLLALHVTGAFFLLGGVMFATILSILGQRAQRPSELAAFMGLARFAVVFILVGEVMVLVFGLWLVHEFHFSFGSFWIWASLVLLAVGGFAGKKGGDREGGTRLLALELAAKDDIKTPELQARLNDRVTLALSGGAGVLALVVLALMIWKPGQ